MLAIPPVLDRLYDTLLERKGVATHHSPHYRKWLRFYWDFCHKYNVEPTDRQSFPAFHEKLRAKNQSEALCKQAYQAVSLYYETVGSDSTRGRIQPAEAAAPPDAEDKPSPAGPFGSVLLQPSPSRGTRDRNISSPAHTLRSHAHTSQPHRTAGADCLAICAPAHATERFAVTGNSKGEGRSCT